MAMMLLPGRFGRDDRGVDSRCPPNGGHGLRRRLGFGVFQGSGRLCTHLFAFGLCSAPLHGTQLQGVLMVAQPSTSSGFRASGPVYLAEGRISRPVCFCSMMCAHQPAVRAQVNMAGIMWGGTSAKSRITAAQNSTFVSIARSG